MLGAGGFVRAFLRKRRFLMYLYQSHLGGLYATDEPLEWENLYCEECGDSDSEIGFVEDGNPEALWNLIKPERLACIGCPKEPDCFEDCEETEPTGTDFGLLYCMKFIEETASDGRGTRVRLICRSAKDGKVHVGFKQNGYAFGERHSIPTSFCLNPELEEKIALCLIPFGADVKEGPRRIGEVRRKNGGKDAFWECVAEPDPDDDGEGAWFDGEGWSGWLDPKEFVPLDGDEAVSEFLRRSRK